MTLYMYRSFHLLPLHTIQLWLTHKDCHLIKTKLSSKKEEHDFLFDLINEMYPVCGLNNVCGCGVYTVSLSAHVFFINSAEFECVS